MWGIPPYTLYIKHDAFQLKQFPERRLAEGLEGVLVLLWDVLVLYLPGAGCQILCPPEGESPPLGTLKSLRTGATPVFARKGVKGNLLRGGNTLGTVISVHPVPVGEDFRRWGRRWRWRARVGRRRLGRRHVLRWALPVTASETAPPGILFYSRSVHGGPAAAGLHGSNVYPERERAGRTQAAPRPGRFFDPDAAAAAQPHYRSPPRHSIALQRSSCASSTPPYREKRPRPRPVRVRSASVSSNSIVRPASGPRPV
eukprot:gene10217-biopygen9316